MNYQLLKIFSLAFFMMLGFAGFAQRENTDTDRQERFDIERLAKDIDLTAEQRSEMATIREAQKAKFDQLRAATPSGERPDREKMRALMKESREQMMSLLTPEQKETLAAKRKEHEKMRATRKEMGEELKAYRAENVLPEIARIRKDFDKELSAEEQAQITSLRGKIKSELGDHAMSRFSMPEGGGRNGHGREGQRFERPDRQRVGDSPRMKQGGQSREEMKDNRGDLHAFVQQHKAEFEAIRAIAKTHQSSISAVRSELDAKKAAWRKDTEAIRMKYADESRMKEHGEGHGEGHGPKRASYTGTKEGGHSDEHNRAGERGGLSREERGAVMFLLMDPNEVVTEGFEDLEEEGVRAYPNPAGKTTNISFTTRQSGLVKVELIDASGKVVKNLFSGDRPEGEFDLRVELPMSSDKTSVVRVTDPVGVRTIMVARN